MVSIEKVRALARSFPDAKEEPHFEKISFRINKKIFATLNVKENRVCVKLSEIDQSVFCGFDAAVIYPVPNKWGKQGWTLINLKAIREAIFLDAFTTSYTTVASKKKIKETKFGK